MLVETAGWVQRHRHCRGAAGKEFETLQEWQRTRRGSARCGNGPVPAPRETS